MIKQWPSGESFRDREPMVKAHRSVGASSEWQRLS
jgi:hypothetical protein